MDLAIMNFQDYEVDHKTHKSYYETLKEAKKARGKECAVIWNSTGPEILTGDLEDNKPVDIEKDSSFIIVTDKAVRGTKDKIVIQYDSLPYVVEAGSPIIIKCKQGDLVTEVVNVS